ncbi:MAG: aminotransferase class I/II-fold pyridoxal phosphate-dependent enzyme [Verrucomicrobiales bacterium]
MARSPASELEALAAAGLHRQLRQCERCDTGLRTKLGDRMVVNFSSNDYLGLASHPSITAAFSEAVNRWGAGSGASRLVCGTMAPHTALEEDLARFKGTESALSFSSGYTAAVGTLSALLQPGDIVILDKLCHVP